LGADWALDPWGARSLPAVRRLARDAAGSVGFLSLGGRACCSRSCIWLCAVCLRWWCCCSGRRVRRSSRSWCWGTSSRFCDVSWSGPRCFYVCQVGIGGCSS